MTQEELKTPYFPNWCPGCGNFAIWGAFKSAAVECGWDCKNTALVAGIGCHGHMVNFVKITSIEGLHGRALPIATGVKLAKPELNVFVFTGDGDALGEGGNHFVHTCRRNHDVNILVHDNALYALTTGQTSPMSPHGFKTKSTPDGNPDNPISPVTLAIASGATFVARAYAGDIPKLTEIIIKAQKHKGTAVIDILQPCVTFNKEYTHKFYQENTYQLGADYDITDKSEAFHKSLEWGLKQIPVGIFYQVGQPSYEDEIKIKRTVDRKNINELFMKYT